jgi:hypothetical protein
VNSEEIANVDETLQSLLAKLGTRRFMERVAHVVRTDEAERQSKAANGVVTSRRRDQVAKSTHRCVRCDVPIIPGERYAVVWDRNRANSGGMEWQKYHLRCEPHPAASNNAK